MDEWAAHAEHVMAELARLGDGQARMLREFRDLRVE